MPLSVKSPEAERLARAVAEATGESLTEAITRSLEERLRRIESAKAFGEYERGVERIQRSIRERTVLDARSADEIIGYGPDGAPR
jgi:antitoxin VapB